METASFPRCALYIDLSSMQTDNLFAEGESDARTVAFGGEERNKDTLCHLRQHAFPVVTDFEDQLLRMSFHADTDIRMRTMGTSLAGVLQQVDEHLFHLCAVGQPFKVRRRIFKMKFRFRIKALQVGKELFQGISTLTGAEMRVSFR